MKILRMLVCCAVSLGGGVTALSARADSLFVTGSETSETVVLPSGDVVLKITESGTVAVKGSGKVWVVVVGGGGGGGIFAGGGGGGGAVVEEKEVSLTAGTYDVVVGKGGSGATTNLVLDALGPATSGGESSAFGISAAGGGAGGGYNIPNAAGTGTTFEKMGSDGASGGGANGEYATAGGKGAVTLADGTTNDGAKGSGYISGNAYAGGGGGGAGGAGFAYAAKTETSVALYPTGGVGVVTAILDTETWFGGGGAGGTSYDFKAAASGGLGGGGAGGGMNGGNNKATPGSDAEANTGGGGGGAGRFYHHTSLTSGNLAEGYRGGNGADGVVLIRFTPKWKAEANQQEGGAVKKSGLYYVHTFAEDATFTVSEPVIVDALVVGGGGAGGWRGATGGGGAGGVIITNALHLMPGAYTVTVGAGGVASETDKDEGRCGSDSLFAGLVAKGGGAGSNNYTEGRDGGSGGGGGGHGNPNTVNFVGGKGTAGQGHDGGANKAAGVYLSNIAATRGGGGGGAGGPGSLGMIVNEDGTSVTWCGDGGDGVMCDFSGSEKWYGGGGGGGHHNYATKVAGKGGKGGGGDGAGYNGGNNHAFPGGDGEAGTGSGGGGGGLLGAGMGETDTAHGGNGGSGIVIIRYKRALPGFAIIVK